MLYTIRIREILTHEFELDAESYENAMTLVGRFQEEQIHDMPITNIMHDLESILPARRLVTK